MSNKRLTNEEFNLLSCWTSKIKIDSEIDIIALNEKEDAFIEFNSDGNKIISLQEGFEILSDAIAYPFEHEGFSEEESRILKNLFEKYTGRELCI